MIDYQMTHVHGKNRKDKNMENKKYGIVYDCGRLNLREKPNLKSKICAILENNTKVEIIKSFPSSDWYKVSINGITGFCLKRYILVEEIINEKGDDLNE